MSQLKSIVAQLAARLTVEQLMLATAESCTGGLIAAWMTSLPGSSAYFERGFVTYSNAAKQELLGVKSSLLTACGAVSAAVAGAMAQGALRYSQADVSIAVTGIAGPDGATMTKPIGTVYIGFAWRERKGFTVIHRRFHGTRDTIRDQTAEFALRCLLAMIDEER